ncbi:uncharacterized protein B0P05DRAFT_521750 [Gilbertella persicaria]|uniref:uncharacterized protein n=1 Tax=Gilbertella persicaria TaxID=101096 RepID=UPI00222006E2|nr:uncharacterized protein B0P05DRAFT_521750 [Gilbertella persicaria]KAI8098388.1 hypothetical protein B0P05DRAFT_521750 [Gilbertella persicaria]
MTNLVSSIDTSLNEPDVGFFIDTTPTKPKRSKKILKDDSIYIESDDDDDDGISISSSEDIDILQALSHWGSNTDLQFDQSVKVKGRSDRDDIALLQNTFMEDICESSEEQEEKDIDMIEDDIDNVPDSLKHSYRIMVKQEISEWKRQHTQRRKRLILHDFIDQDQVQTYSLGHLTHHGRTMIVPILAKLFQLEVTPMDTSQKHIMLTKTVHTSIPSFYTESTHKKKKTRQKKEWHAPIPSSNIGHRMLSAMGWKEGEGINKDGIKEPVKVFMRANRKGLGAS